MPVPQFMGEFAMICRTYGINTLGQYKYVVVLSGYQGKILLSRHRERMTWETQGGHIEPGETPMEAAKRELYEESGAVEFDLRPLCDYWAGEENGEGAAGMVLRRTSKDWGKCPTVRWRRPKPLKGCPKILPIRQSRRFCLPDGKKLDGWQKERGTVMKLCIVKTPCKVF